MASIPGMRFLVCCASMKDEDLASIWSTDSNLDWPEVFRLATWHGMMPLLVQRLLPIVEQQASPHVPAVVEMSLRSFKERHMVRAMTQLSALVELQGAFDAAKLRVVSWKGPSLALQLYGSSFLRTSADLDFLVLKEDVPALRKILMQLGYQAPPLLTKQDHYKYRLQHEFEFHRITDRSALELHAQIMTASYLTWQDTSELVERASTLLAFGGTHLLLLNPEDLLLSLCVHALKHNWDRMKWSYDIVRFVEIYREQIAWATMLTSLNERRKGRVVLLGLAVAQKLFGLRLPEAAEEHMRVDPGLVALAGIVADHMLTGSSDAIAVESIKALNALYCEGLRDRLWFSLWPLLRLEYEDIFIKDPKHPLYFLNLLGRFYRLVRLHGIAQLFDITVNQIRSSR